MDIDGAMTMQDTNTPSWKNFAVIGSILIINTIYPQISFSGPWDSESFTVGVFGLLGLSLIYISWYRFTFGRKGLIPWMDNLANPSESSKIELLIGFIFVFGAWFTGNIVQDNFPAPTGLILALIGALLILHSVYVLLSIGPLKDD
jgi:hypothetical protein